MITINTTDFNLKKILQESKLSNLVTRNKYYVYGLCQENNPAIIIEYNNNKVNKNFKKNIESLVEFFKLNEMEIQTYGDFICNKVSIGLRRDMRDILNSNKRPIFASSVLCTIVYALEDRINIEQMKKYKLNSLPRLNNRAA